MPDQLLDVLKLCLLALLYLFFLRVLRAVWTEIGASRHVESLPSRKPAKPRRQRRAGASLEVLEPKADKGVRYHLDVETAIGRASNCAIRIDDGFVSQVHARVFQRDGAYFVEDLGSTNGTYLNRQRVQGAVPLSPGDRLQVGNTVMEMS